MRKLILILLIFVCKLSDAQVYQLMPQYGYDAKRMKFDSTLQIPTTCGVPTLRSTYTKYSAIAFDTCNNRFYVYNSKTLVWDTLKGGTGGGGSTPSLQQVTDVGNTTTNDLYVEFSPGHIVSGVFTDGSIAGSVFRVYSNGDSVGVVDSKVDIQINNNDVTRNKVLQLPVKSGVIAVVEDVIDSLKRSRDSVFARKNGQWNFQYKDSIGTGGGGSTDTTSLSNRINNAYTTITKLTDTSFFLTKPNTLKDTIRFNKDVVYTENPILTRVSNDSTIIYLNSDSASLYRRVIDTTNAFLISVSQPNDSSLTFRKGATSTTYTIRSSIAGSATRLVTTAYNNTGVTIAKGSVVYITGRHSSNLPTIALAQANNEANSYKTFALVENDIANNSAGIIIQAGNITNLNLPTSTYTDGDVLYLSPTIAGGYTTTKPLAPNHICKLGSVTRAHPTFGTIEIKIENGWQLDELSDVSIATVPADSTLLQFSRLDSLWHDVSVVNAIGNKYIKPSDTATMLSPYQRSISAMKYTDSASMLTPYLRKIDTAVFDRKSAAAYTFRANNTGGAANVTDQTFRQSGMQTYTGTIAFGGTAPSGATNHTYNFTQVGNLVTLNVTLIYATAGTSVTTITLPLPADCPAPKEQTGLGATNDVLYYGVFQSTSNLAYSNTSRNCVIRKKSATVGDVELTSTIAASNNRFFSFTIQYFTN